jgi:hypothetical protein
MRRMRTRMRMTSLMRRRLMTRQDPMRMKMMTEPVPMMTMMRRRKRRRRGGDRSP